MIEADAGRVQVVLKSRGKDSFIEVIKAVRELTQMGLKEAKEFTERCPVAFPGTMDGGTANNFKRRLEAAGGEVELR